MSRNITSKLCMLDTDEHCENVLQYVLALPLYWLQKKNFTYFRRIALHLFV